MRWRLPRRRGRSVPDYGRIAPWLFVGPALDETGYAHLAERGVTHVLDLRSEASDDPALMDSLNLGWLRVPIDDREAPSTAQLNEIDEWIDAQASEAPVVYVHCEGGLGRSPTVAMALLMRRGFTRAEAHRLVLGARSVAAPTPPQFSWLDEIQQEIERHAEHRDLDQPDRP
jgi:protein-tyrosine phosphatase